MKMTTLCYLERGDEYLMLHRTKKENDENHDKWIGVGGKFEAGESPEDCMRREIFEETGLTVTEYSYRGIVTFVSDLYGTEYMHLFTANGYDGEINYDSAEGKLEWVKKEDVCSLPIWEGDKIFFELLNSEVRFFSLKLTYEGDKLTISFSAKYLLDAIKALASEEISLHFTGDMKPIILKSKTNPDLTQLILPVRSYN